MPKPKLPKPKKRACPRGVVKNISTKPQKDNVVGCVFIGQTKYIDIEPKLSRRYLVLQQKGNYITISKIKSIKQFDEKGKNADPYLVEINQNYPGLSKRSGVDKHLFNKNRMTHKPLSISDKKVFNAEPEFCVSGRDLKKAQIHTGIKKYNKH